MGPAKSIPMNAIMIYMSGTSLQIFTVMVTAMLFFQPAKAIMSVQQSMYLLLVGSVISNILYKQPLVVLKAQAPPKINPVQICSFQSWHLLDYTS
jgi:hypothetical protein